MKIVFLVNNFLNAFFVFLFIIILFSFFFFYLKNNIVLCLLFKTRKRVKEFECLKEFYVYLCIFFISSVGYKCKFCCLNNNLYECMCCTHFSSFYSFIEMLKKYVLFISLCFKNKHVPI